MVFIIIAINMLRVGTSFVIINLTIIGIYSLIVNYLRVWDSINLIYSGPTAKLNGPIDAQTYIQCVINDFLCWTLVEAKTGSTCTEECASMLPIVQPQRAPSVGPADSFENEVHIRPRARIC